MIARKALEVERDGGLDMEYGEAARRGGGISRCVRASRDGAGDESERKLSRKRIGLRRRQILGRHDRMR